MPPKAKPKTKPRAAAKPAARATARPAARTANGRSSSARVTPLGDRVVVKQSRQEEVLSSGIVIPDTAREKPSRRSHRRRPRPPRRRRQARPHGRRRRRPRPLRQVHRPGDQGSSATKRTTSSSTRPTSSPSRSLAAVQVNWEPGAETRSMFHVPISQLHTGGYSCRKATNLRRRGATLASRPASTSSPTPSRSPSAPAAAASSSTRSTAPRPSSTTASPSPRRSSSATPSRTWAPSSPRKSPRKTNDVAGDGTTTATVLGARPSSARA